MRLKRPLKIDEQTKELRLGSTSSCYPSRSYFPYVQLVCLLSVMISDLISLQRQSSEVSLSNTVEPAHLPSTNMGAINCQPALPCS